ncbi:MAG: T9SS type A sorting domain-containing protein [Flavitalea sp.]
MRPLYSFVLVMAFLVGAAGLASAQTVELSKSVDNITTGLTGTLASQNDILEYTITIKNLSTVNITSSELTDNIPAGTSYVAGSTRLNTVTVADVSGRMRYSGAGALINSPGASSGLLRPNVAAVIRFRVRVTANGGNISNYAVLEAVYQGNALVQNTNTVFTNLSPDPACSVVYQSTANAEWGIPQSTPSRPYRYIKALNTSNGQAGLTIYNGATGLCFDAISGNSLGAGSLLTYASAIAYDKNSNRIYFVNNSSASAQDLCFVDLNTIPVSAKRYTGYPLETVTGAGYNINRMSFASDGFGYGITDNAQSLIRFSINSSGLPVITKLGALLNATSNGTNDILDENGGDIFGDGSGNLYLIANSSNLYKINPNTRIATFLGSVDPFPGTSNSIAVDASGNVFIGGAYQNVYTVNLATMAATSITGGNTSNVWTNGDYTSCAFPVLAPALTANKTYNNINGKPFVIGGDTVEYRIEVSNTGNINAAGVRLYDAIPSSTAYIQGSTKLNGVVIPDVSGAMPYSFSGGKLINSVGEQAGIIKPGAAYKVIMTFRARIAPGQYICNQSRITLIDDNGNTMFINSDDPTQTGSQNPTCFYSDGVLPSTHISLKGNLFNTESNLNWTIQTDQQVKQYEVEYSKDGRYFVNAGKIQPLENGSVENRYKFTDVINKDNLRFYRLKLIGKNGLVTYSEVVRLSTSDITEATAMPNPFTRELRVQLQLKTSGNVNVRLLDFQGRPVLDKVQSLQKGSQVLQLEIPEHLANGIYILEVFAGNERVLNKKMIRQN